MSTEVLSGGCTCGALRYRLNAAPMIVHCCHCSWCQRETGSAFAVNAVIEHHRLETTAGTPEYILTPSASGKGQEIARCPDCRVAVWSHYAGSGRLSAFVRVGTLDETRTCPPDVHIFTSTKQDWIVLPGDVLTFPEFYPTSQGVWSEGNRARWGELLAQAGLGPSRTTFAD